MDVVIKVREYLRTWTKGGDIEWLVFAHVSRCIGYNHPHSRKLLIEPHCDPTDPRCLDVLMTVYHTLLCATLSTWNLPHSLTPVAFVEFLNSVLSSLPSTSNPSQVHSNTAIFGDYLVDVIWSVDTELDELLGEARLAVTASSSQTHLSQKELSHLTSKVKKAQQLAEIDKQRIPVIVKKLLVWFLPCLHSLIEANFFYLLRRVVLSAWPIAGKDWKMRFWRALA